MSQFRFKKTFSVGLQAALIIATGIWVYSPAVHGGWVWDDAAEIAHNPVLRDPAALRKIWLAPAGADYFPLKTTLQWIEWRRWGSNPFGYHLTNIAFHLLGALLFWRLLVKLNSVRPGTASERPRPGVEWLGALLFVVHPLAVESVAWIAEMKNTFSLLLLLGAMIAYVDFDRRGRARSYFWAFLFFLFATLAKTTVVMFPVIILLYVWWRRGRVSRRDLVRTAPFFAVALGLGLITVWFQQHRAIAGSELGAGNLGTRVTEAGLAVGFYWEKFFVPVGLMPIYPRPAMVALPFALIGSWLILAGWTAYLWTKRPTWGRALLFGFGWFGINLLPVLGVIPMAYSRISWVSDHFVYLPMLGLIGLAVGGAGLLADRLARAPRGLRFSLAVAAGIFCGALAITSHRQAAAYRDDQVFWTQALAQNPQAWLAHNNLGLIFTDRGRLPEAIDQLETALRLRPDYAEAHNNLGDALARSRRLPEAIAQFVAALRLEPNYVVARDNLGSALIQSGRREEAIGQFRQVLQLQPDLAEAHASLGFALASTGRLEEAIPELQQALRLDPAAPNPHYYLGLALRSTGRLAEAEAQFREAARLRPGQ